MRAPRRIDAATRAALVALAATCAALATGCGSGSGGGADADEGDRPRPARAPATESGKAAHFRVERIAAGLNRPTFVGAAPGDPDALWVLEQPGRVLRLSGPGVRTGNRSGGAAPTDRPARRVVLDIADEVTLGGEQGLLGIAFHPDFATDRRLYLHWSGPLGATRVAELRMRADGTVDPDRRRYLLRLGQPEENHNGGQLAFGPDGRLYLGLGDGGGAFDPEQRAQDLDDLHGKIVSTDVDAHRPRWRVELYGLRNPWRFSFDPALGELWIADVGQDEVEEVNRVLLEPDEPPKNLGWGVFEGVDQVRPEHRLDRSGELVWPVATYSHDDGCSITGGQIYRGAAISRLAGRYVYGDFCSGVLWSLEPTPGGRATDVRRERASVPQLTHIGRDSAGGLVFASATGAIYRAVAARR